jgi:nitrogen fixation-related uncharacterized protein
MDFLALPIGIIIAILAFEAAGLLWGVDSRDQMPDDHRRDTNAGSA